MGAASVVIVAVYAPVMYVLAVAWSGSSSRPSCTVPCVHHYGSLLWELVPLPLVLGFSAMLLAAVQRMRHIAWLIVLTGGALAIALAVAAYLDPHFFDFLQAT
jgi:hypothetical protein